MVVPLIPATAFGPPICGGPRWRGASPVPLITPRLAPGDRTFEGESGPRPWTPLIPATRPVALRGMAGDTGEVGRCTPLRAPRFSRGKIETPIALRAGVLDARGSADNVRGWYGFRTMGSGLTFGLTLFPKCGGWTLIRVSISGGLSAPRVALVFAGLE